jgi:cell wall-associated NlpC family hydrolase
MPLAGSVLSTARAASASTIGALQAEAGALAVRVGTLDNRLSILSEEYDQAENRSGMLDQQIHADASALGAAQSRVRADGSTLRREAVNAYVTAGSTTGISVALSSSEDALALQQTYMRAASGNLLTAVSSLQVSEHQLSVRQAALAEVDAAARKTAQAIASSRSNALGIEEQLQATLAGVNGQLAVALAEQQAAHQAAIARAAAIGAERAAAEAASNPATNATLTDQPSPGSGNGGAAVQAAASALGSPYEWAGDSLSGFDCSGLTMWAWAQAGVSLPHSAQAQYDSIEHVSLSDLEPGDLIFYAESGYIYHVIMYVGGGRAIQAEDYGTVVQYTPVWSGAIGAGRP